VRKNYAEIAKQESSCCDTDASCGCAGVESSDIASRKIGYTDREINTVPEGSNLGLGCGNPTGMSSIKEGETVLDLGSGAGFDAFIAANKVGENGRVIGVDMTPEMIDKARRNAEKGSYKNVEFRLGEIENLPIGNNLVDAIISNCVINLSTNKERVFQEAFRVLKPGGQITISDIVLSKDLPESIKNNVAAYTGCVSGAIQKEEYLKMIKDIGFQDINIINEVKVPIPNLTDATISITVKGTKSN
jgi:SAM-dependent methyltransferase